MESRRTGVWRMGYGLSAFSHPDVFSLLPRFVGYCQFQIYSICYTGYFYKWVFSDTSNLSRYHLFLLAGGVQDSGCHPSPGPFAFSHGSCPYFFLRNAGSALSCSCVAVSAALSFTACDSGAIGCDLIVLSAGIGWPCSRPGASMTLGFASQRASAWAASIFIFSWRWTSWICSWSEGGCSRTWRSH